jgi:glycosyltransferase involved in cell wall biosynthesis
LPEQSSCDKVPNSTFLIALSKEICVLHPSLCQVGGAEVLLVKQAALLASLGASVRIRTLAYDSERWRERIGTLPVTALRAIQPGRQPPRNPRSPSDRRIGWLLDGIARADVAIAHNYPTSSALGMAMEPRLRIWYCHEPPRFLYPDEVSPFLHENSARAPSRHGPRYYEGSLRSWFGALPLVGRRSPRRKAVDQRGVRGLNAIWANSEYTRDALQRAYGASDVEVVYPMVDVPAVTAERSGLPREGLRILTLTRLEWVKNLDTLLEGFVRFRLRDDPRAELHIVGEGPAEKPLRKQAKRLGVEAAVHLHGFLDESRVLDLSARCHVFACLPFDEPFGMVFPEAMARGLLVLGPNHGGPFEILDGGRLGEVADALSPEAIAEGLSRLRGLSDSDANRRRSDALVAVEQRFSREAMATRVTSLLARHGVRF